MKSIEIDRSKMLKDDPGKGHNRWHPDVTPILEVDTGEEVRSRPATPPTGR